MAVNNQENKEILWKYKEFFVFPELEGGTQDGELDLLLAIIDDNTRIIEERSMAQFISNLHKRINSKYNFVRLLEIYNKLINYESGDNVKTFLLKIISNDPRMLNGEEKDNIDDYIASINAKEVLLNILFGGIDTSGVASANINSALTFSIDTFITSFPLDRMLEKIEMSMETLGYLGDSIEENEYVNVDDLAEREQKSLILLYASMYLNRYSEHFNSMELITYFYETFLPGVEKRLDKALDAKTDLALIPLSEVKLLTQNLPILSKKMKFLLSELNKTYDERFQEMTTNIGKLEHKFRAVDAKTQCVVLQLKNSRVRKWQIMFKDYHEYEEFEEFRDEENTSQKSNKSHNDDKQENGFLKLTKMIGLAKKSIVDKVKNNKVGAQDCVTKPSKILHATWDSYVDKIMASKSLNNEVKSINKLFADAIYEELTNKDQETNNLNVYSYKVFIANALEYIWLCQKEASTLYVVTYMFQTLATLVDKCSFLNDSEDPDVVIEKHINKNILDILDTTKNIKLVFLLLSLNIDSNKYSGQTFMMSCYFMNKLINVRTLSIQNKLQILFENHSGSQSFFTKVNRYMDIYSTKIANGVLKEKYSNQEFTDEASNRCYYIDKSLEKQMILFIKNCWSRGNVFMQDFMRKQENNNRSYNIVQLVTEFLNVFTDHLHFPIVYEIFISCLDWLLEFIQGPNKANQIVLVMNDFVSLANDILMLDYHRKRKRKERGFKEVVESVSKVSLKTNSSKSRQKTASLGKSMTALQHMDNQIITLPSKNHLISLAKYRVLLVLNFLLNGFDINHYVFYLYRRELNPVCFRKTFAYQKYYFDKYYKSDYTNQVFFNYSHESNDDEKPTPCIMEIGFLAFYILKKMQENIDKDPDERYESQILKLVGNKPKPTSEKNLNVIQSTWRFYKDVYTQVYRAFKPKSSSIVAEDLQEIQDSNSALRKVLKFYNKWTSKIEVIHNDHLQTIYFPRYPHCTFLDTDAKEAFNSSVDRSTARTKCEGLIRNSEWLDSALMIEYQSTQNIFFFSLIFRNMSMFTTHFFFMIFVINLLLTIGLRDGNNSNVINRNIQLGSLSESQSMMVIKVLGYYLSFLYIWIFTKEMYLIIKSNIARHRIFVEKSMKKGKAKERSREFYGQKLVSKVIYYCKEYILKILFDIKVLFHLMLLFCVLFNFILETVIGYPVLVTYIIYKSQTLRNVLTAVAEPYVEIAMTMVLYFSIAWGASVYIFYSFSEEYDVIVEDACYNLWSWFVTTFDQGYKTGAGSGAAISNPYRADSGTNIHVDVDRLIFEYFIYFVLVVLVFSILTGIIIDKFSELRERSEDLERDNNSSCFMCNQSAAELDKKQGYEGFNNHIYYDHNKWDYVFFLSYLRYKKRMPDIGMFESERIVYEKGLKDDNSWLPCDWDYHKIDNVQIANLEKLAAQNQ